MATTIRVDSRNSASAIGGLVTSGCRIQQTHAI